MDYLEGILFDNLEYLPHMLEYPGSSVIPFIENENISNVDFNKLYTKKIRFSDGKDNIIYLLTNNFDNMVKMLKVNNFVFPPSYKKIFYPYVTRGKFFNKQFSVNVRGNVKERNSLINSETRMKPYGSSTIDNIQENIIFNVSDIYLSLVKIMERTEIKRLYSEFWSEFINILNTFSPGGEKRRVMIIDCDAFSFKVDSSLNDNKTNPLFLLYLAYLRTRDLSKLNVDIDMLIYSKNMFMKFNPSMITDSSTWSKFRNGLFKIMNTNLDNYTSSLDEDEKKSIEVNPIDHSINAIIDNKIDPFVRNVSPSTKAALAGSIEKSLKDKAARVAILDKNIKDAQEEISNKLGVKKDQPPMDLFQRVINNKPTIVDCINPAMNPLDNRHEKLFRSLGSYTPLGIKSGLVIDDEDDLDNLRDFEDEIEDDVGGILNDDEQVLNDVLEEIQDQVAPLHNPKTAPINSARDKKLREEQKKIVVKSSTIEEILNMDSSNVNLEPEDKSSVMHTSNNNMKTINFTFDKTYLDKMYMRDILACFDMLKDKESPFYITGIDIKDTSDVLNLKETWTVHLTDENKKRHTIKVDIPKFQNERFMFIEGTKYIILKQNFYNPLVKDTPDTVIMTTNFNKITIQRKSTKSLGVIERIFSLIKKTGDNETFVIGDSTRGNLKYISSLEYDEISRRLFKFSSNNCNIYFSRDYISDNLSDSIPKDIKSKEFYIGNEGSNPVIIDEDTGLDRQGRTIAEIIENNLSDEYRAIFNSIKPPSQSMYVECKLAGEFIPVAVALLVWEGLTNTLDRMKINWKFNPDMKKIPQGTTSLKYIRFSDGVLEYEAKTFAELILNGLMKLKPEKLTFESFNNEESYSEFMYAQWGNYNGITQVKNFYEFLIDPITKNDCKMLSLPDDPAGLLIHAVKLLCDNAFVSKASDQSYRVRSIEMIPAILYSCLALQYQAYVRSGRTLPMTLNRKCVIQKLIAEKTVEAYSTLNPVVEVSKTHTISTKGYKGSNSEHSYDEKKRSYHPTSVGKIAISTSADANVGINKSLVIEPTISNVRGYRDQVEDVETLKDVNVFSPVEMLTPGTARYDDPIRTAIATKQSQHVVPVEDASPALVSNGYDEAVQFSLSDDFVINAEEDGKVIDINEELGFIVVKYKSGKSRAIYTKPEIVKNSGGGFYISNQLTPTHTKIGETFKKDEVLAYHDKYFRYSKMNGLRYAIGPIVKMAFMSSYNTYEDAGICTESLGNRMATKIVYQQVGKFKKNNNIISMVKVGDHVNIGDSLIRFDTSTEDNELAKYLTKLSEENANILEDVTKNDIKADHAGEVIDIKVYTLYDPSNLSPSLGKIVQEYFDIGINKKEYLEQFDSSEGIIKAGYMLTDSTEPTVNRYNTIKGNKGVDVLIEIHIEHKDVMGVGDKIALYSANKQIVSEVIPKGYEPYSEFRPDEEISVMTSPGTIARRMTGSVIPISAAFKIMIELKRKIKKEIRYK